MAARRPNGTLSLGRRLIRGIDAISRRMQRIREFDASPDCLLRIATGRVRRGIRLSDGVVLEAGDPFVELHLWNEHLAVPAHGADLRWAAARRRQFARSLRKLADHMSANAEFADVRALMMKPALPDPKLERAVGRIVTLFGFEWRPAAAGGHPESFVGRCADNLWLWLLTWAFNPRSLKGRSFAQERHEFWISRDRLVALYGGDDQAARAQAWRSELRATARGMS